MSKEEICDRLLKRFLVRFSDESPDSKVSDTFISRLRKVILSILIGEGEEKALDFVETAKIR